MSKRGKRVSQRLGQGDSKNFPTINTRPDTFINLHVYFSFLQIQKGIIYHVKLELLVCFFSPLILDTETIIARDHINSFQRKIEQQQCGVVVKASAL